MGVDVEALKRAAEGALLPESLLFATTATIAPWHGVDILRDADFDLADAEFMAAADPTTILALLDRLNVAERRVARATELEQDFRDNIDWSSGRSNYGDNAAWESAADSVAEALR